MAQPRFALDVLDRRPRGADGRVVWVLLAGNGRPLGRSGTGFADDVDGASEARRLKRLLTQGEPLIDKDRRTGQWRWSLAVEDEIIAVSQRQWVAQGAAQTALAKFLATVPDAGLPDGVDDEPDVPDLPEPELDDTVGIDFGAGTWAPVEPAQPRIESVEPQVAPWAVADVLPVSPAEHPVIGMGSFPSGAGPRGAQIDAVQVSAWFGSNRVLDKVSLSMPPGTVTALIGPSGCGKSTFLRILNRMHELVPSARLAGEVRLDNQDIYAPGRRIQETRKRIGMVFQRPNPFPSMSVYENVISGLKLNGIKASAAEKDDLVEQCLRRGGLWSEVKDRLSDQGSALSGGQQQRLCIARSLAVQPEVLLMDEPCSALDPTSTRRIEETIEELSQEVTIVIVTHNMQQAARVSQQSAFFLAEQGTPGRIVEAGATTQVFEDPIDPRTRDYVNGRFG